MCESLWTTESVSALPGLDCANGCGTGHKRDDADSHRVYSSGRGLTATAGYTPFGGDFKRMTQTFRERTLGRADRDTALQLWIWTLAFAAFGLTVGLVGAGYRVTHPVALADD